MSTADLFGSDSSGDEFDPAEAAAEEEEQQAGVHNEDENAGRTGSSGGGDADVLEDSDDNNNNNNNNNTNAVGGEPSSAAFEPATGGTGLSDSEDEEPQKQTSAADASKRADADVFGTDSEDDVGGPSGGGGAEADGGGSGAAEGDLDPFEDSDDDGDQGGGSGSQEGKTLRGGGGGRLSKGGSSGKGKGKKRKAGADGGGSSKKKSKSKGLDDGDASTKKKKKKKRKRKDGEEGGEGEGGGGSGGKKKTKHKKKKGKKKKKTSAESSALQDLGLESSADEAADEDEDDDMSDEEVEHEDEDEDGVVSGEEAAGAGDVRTRNDDDFIDNSDDNADLLEEYKRDAPEEGDHSEAEEDNGPEDDAPKKESAMSAVLASMKKRKSQELGTAEREQIAQEFMFKINQAAEDDEESVQNQSPAIYKLKMLPTVKATLAKKELQETFLEFDLLGVLKRWLQPYSNKQLPNLTVRRAILELIRGLPVQIDHLKRSGIGKTVMGLLNCKEETTENKRILRELVSKWNRPVYEKETNYRARRPAHDDLEAMEVRPKGASAARRRVVSGGSMSQRDFATRDEAVGNILNARAKGIDPTKSRVPFSNGYAFSKAPRSRVEGGGRAASQQVDTSARAKMLKKIAGLAKPVSKSA